MSKFFINSWYLLQGTIAQVAYHILDELGCPYDTSGATAAYLEAKNADGSKLSVQATSGVYLGMHTPVTVWIFPLTIDQLAALPLGRSDAFVRIVYSDSEKILPYPGSLHISAKPI
jgi:hypothetical protein